MSHEITVRDDGFAEMFFTGATPWHGLGNKLDGPATSEEAIQAAGLDWEVERAPIFTAERGPLVNGIPQLVYQAQDKFRLIRREDTKQPFAVMGKGYTPIQNREAFKFFDGVVAQGQAIYHTAGSLSGGRRVWILAQLPGSINIDGRDQIQKFVLLFNAHDGSQSLQMMITPVRVVCANTLGVALGDSSTTRFRARHTIGIMDRMIEARQLLQLTDAYFENLMVGIEELVDLRMTINDVEKWCYGLFGLEEGKPLADQTPSKWGAVSSVKTLFNTGVGNHGESGWDAFNAVTEYLDHERAYRGSVANQGKMDETAVSKRLEYSWFGDGSRIKQKAWDSLVNLRGDISDLAVVLASARV